MSGEIRYGAFKVATSCSSCGNPLIVNGPQTKPVCPACSNPTKLGPGIWQSIIEDYEKGYAGLESGSGSESTMMTHGLTIKYSYFKLPPPAPSCPTCEEAWDLEAVVTGTDGVVTCKKCGRTTPTYPAPDWLKGVIPTAIQVFFGERSEGDAAGKATVDPGAEANRPVVLACPQCGGSLKITAESARTVPCTYCNVDVYLPDGVWNKLHPAKVAKFWLLRFAGDYRALKRELKEKKKAEQ
jgi:hypothetical protein